MRRLPMVLAIAFYAQFSWAQTFENVTAAFEGNTIIVTYDLVHSNADDQFAVTLFGSHNNYSEPIRLVAGSVGQNQKPGTQKRIEWDIKRELNTYQGNIVFELRGVIQLVKLSFKDTFTSARRGKSRTIAWVGGTGQANVKVDVLKDNVVVNSLGEKKNSGSLEWAVPSDMSKGKGYTIRLSTSTETISSAPFAVKAKIPLLLKLSPIILVPLIFLKKDPEQVEDDLPFAPDPK